MREPKRRGAELTMAAMGLAAGAYAGWTAYRQWSVTQANRTLQRGRRILILGAGFGGMNAAWELARLLPSPQDATITLVDRNNFLLFTPMLTEVAGGELNSRHIVHPTYRLPERVRFEQGHVEEIDLDNRRVTISNRSVPGLPSARQVIEYDHLVIALGAVANFHDTPGVKEHAIGMKTINEAATVRNRVMASLERAGQEPDAAARRRLLTFVVGGGGYTGVEAMAAINDLAREEARNYRRVSPEDIRTVLVHAGPRLLPELPADLGDFATEKLRQRGVEIHLNTKVTGAGEDYVEIEGGERIPTRMLIWSGGVRPSPVIEKLGLELGKHHGVKVDGTCAVPGHPGLWAIGDCAEIPLPDGSGLYTATAQNSQREGAHVARNIAAVLRGHEPEPFRYDPIGFLAVVGRHDGVASIWGMKFHGFIAWALWRGVYWAKMPDLSQRIRIGLDWMLDEIFGRDVAALPAASGTDLGPVTNVEKPAVIG